MTRTTRFGFAFPALLAALVFAATPALTAADSHRLVVSPSEARVPPGGSQAFAARLPD